MKYQYTNKRILLVSDDPSVREALSEMLQTAEFNVLLAENGSSAVKTLRSNIVSVIVLDCKTPFETKDVTSRKSKTLSALTDVDPLLPVILTCADNVELDHETALMADLVLHHPVQAPALLEGIDRLLGESLRERAYRKWDYIATLR